MEAAGGRGVKGGHAKQPGAAELSVRRWMDPRMGTDELNSRCDHTPVATDTSPRARQDPGLT